MKIALGEHSEIIITSDELSLFAYDKVRRGSVNVKPSVAPYGDRDVFSSFSYKTIKSGETFIITGEPDGVYTFGKEHIVETVKKVKRVSSSTNPLSDPAFLAKS